MAHTEKKMAAALAAVNAYMQQEEEAVCHQQLSASAITQPQSQTDINLWGLSGRQEMMSMRHLIQMKAFLRF